MMAIFGNCLLDVFGGMMAAALAALAAWQLFKLTRFPEIGPWTVLISLFLIPGAPRSPFAQMMMLFLGIAALALIPVGRSWRSEDRIRRLLKAASSGRRPNSPKRHMPA